MLYALINGVKCTPETTGDRAFCPFTGSEMIAKCGLIKIPHWAYKSVPEDVIYKEESEWHLEWKQRFPKEFVEVLHIDKFGTKHIADYDDGQNVIEFQSSPIRTTEALERELFYTSLGRNFIWVLKAENYTNEFSISKVITKTTFAIAYCRKERRAEILQKFGEYDKNGNGISKWSIEVDSKNVGWTVFSKLPNTPELDRFLTINYINNPSNYNNFKVIEDQSTFGNLVRLQTRKRLFVESRSTIIIDNETSKLYNYSNNNIISLEDFCINKAPRKSMKAIIINNILE